ncbi:secretory calcium-binding phosphoprotein 1 [Scomber japonicus]|uniref:secretory calcium-binding phosphoprotein 1 n=1 Tax=Scomber japonicus TaxID=13676 RepID=UPI002306A0A3|nr:secretory calcium-binding phosphoprotein 1 [Scomber japonicus]
MKGTIITFCLIGAIFANPISFNTVFESSELDANTTESMSISQSSENTSNDTSELQSSEENMSSQSSESESLESTESPESTSEDTTSEESNSQSDEKNSMDETRDNSMGSEENVRKSWVQVFASVIKVLSAEDNSTEVKGQSEENQLVDKPSDSSDTTSDSADTSNSNSVTTATSDSSESTSIESNETSEASDSSDLKHVKAQDCVNGTQSCESDEYFFQDIGDDAHYSVDNLMMPDEDDREFSLRR